jgi:hypothetical protein
MRFTRCRPNTTPTPPPASSVLSSCSASRARHEVTARVAAIDWRCLALARLYHRPEFKYWSVRSHDGVITIGPILLEAAAIEPLIETGGEPGFDADRFFKRLRLH